MLAMFAGENRDDWDDLLPAVMMVYRSSVHESTGYSPMFGGECTLPMDVGLPRQDPDLPDPITSPYAVWVCHALEVDYDQVRGIRGRLYDDRRGSIMGELSDGCSRWVIGPYVITHLQRNVNWIQLGSVRTSCPWQVGLSGFSYNRIHPLSLYIVRT